MGVSASIVSRRPIRCQGQGFQRVEPCLALPVWRFYAGFLRAAFEIVFCKRGTERGSTIAAVAAQLRTLQQPTSE